jgi:hypothetical protein
VLLLFVLSLFLGVHFPWTEWGVVKGISGIGSVSVKEYDIFAFHFSCSLFLISSLIAHCILNEILE